METDLIELDSQSEKRAARLHEEATIIDGLIPTDAYIGDETYGNHLQRGGVTAGNFTVAQFEHDYITTVKELTKYHELAAVNDDEWEIIDSVTSLQEVKRAGKTGIILGFQDTRPIEGELGKLQTFDHLGVKIIQLTYNEQNYVGAGCCERTDGGLTNFGQNLIDELNNRNILIDLSHCAEKTTIEAIEYSNDPVAFTHAGVHTLCNARGRNKTDEHLRALADTNGVIGISLFPPLVKRDPETHHVQPATIHDVLDQIDYLVDKIGVEHVGFGSDLNDKALDEGVTPPGSSLRHYRPSHPEVFGRGPTETYDPYPEGLNRHTKMQNLTRGLIDRGYSDEEVKKILGGNFLRLFEEVWDE